MGISSGKFCGTICRIKIFFYFQSSPVKPLYMEPKFISISNINLAYTIYNPQQTNTIFFFHGNSSSQQSWQHQLNSPLFSPYRLIAFDLPAHGLSDAGAEFTDGYSPTGIARLMSDAVLKLADEKPYLLAGFSLGTNIISEILQFHVLPIGIVLVSSCTISVIDDLQKVFLPNPNAGILFQDGIDAEGLENLVKDSFFNHNTPDAKRYREDFIATKTPFRSLLIKSSMEGKVTDELAALRRTGIPLLVVFGKEEKNVNPGHMDDTDLFLWKKRVFKLQNACHFVHVDQPEVFNRLLAEYAADCFTPAHF
jgi:pimeloyl-ACP methyl ester carboxylesterase